MRSVLITGSTGFVGTSLARHLCDRGWKVSLLGRRPPPGDLAERVRFIRGDLGAAESLRGCCEGAEVVFHTAARVGVWGPEAEFFRINVLGTRALLAEARGAGTRSFIYTSTPSVVHGGAPISGANEAVPYGVRFPCAYPASKAQAEREVLVASTPELRTLALRPHLIWGPGDAHLIPRLLARARAGRLIRVGDGRNRVDFTYIDNCVEAQRLAAEHLDGPSPSGQGRAFFVSDGEPVLLWEFIDRLLRAHGLPPVRRSMSLGRARLLGRLCEMTWSLLRLQGEPPLTTFVADQLAQDHWFDITALRRNLGYRPVVTVQEGLLRLASASGVKPTAPAKPAAPTPAPAPAARPEDAPQEADYQAAVAEMIAPGGRTKAAPAPPRKRQREEVLARIGALAQLPTLASLAKHLQQSLLPQDADLREVARLIENDPSLTTRVLKMANSAIYGGLDEIEDLEGAILRLGLRNLRLLTTTFSTVDEWSDLATEFDWRLLWIHGAATAMLSERVATLLGLGTRPLLYSAGLVHDLGKIILSHLFPSEYRHILERALAEDAPLLDLEQRLFGTDHEEAGLQFAIAQRLPPVIQIAMSHHRRPELAPSHKEDIAIVNLADHFAKLHGMGFSGQKAEVERDIDTLPGWTVLGHAVRYRSGAELAGDVAGEARSLRAALLELFPPRRRA